MFSSHQYNEAQSLDLYLVDQPGRPLVVCLHGGGFNAGHRDDERCRQAAALLTKAGFNCASLSYSLGCSGNRFSMWPRNLFDVADAISFLHDHADVFGYQFKRFGMFGFSAGCCLSNLYMQGGEDIFNHLQYRTRTFRPAGLVGFYGPYDFPSRQSSRRSEDDNLNLLHSPSYWLKRNAFPELPPVLHVQGDMDDIVTPDQHAAFEADYRKRGHCFRAIIAKGFGHSFAPRDCNALGQTIDIGTEITGFFSACLIEEADAGAGCSE